MQHQGDVKGRSRGYQGVFKEATSTSLAFGEPARMVEARGIEGAAPGQFRDGHLGLRQGILENQCPMAYDERHEQG